MSRFLSTLNIDSSVSTTLLYIAIMEMVKLHVMGIANLTTQHINASFLRTVELGGHYVGVVLHNVRLMVVWEEGKGKEGKGRSESLLMEASVSTRYGIALSLVGSPRKAGLLPVYPYCRWGGGWGQECGKREGKSVEVNTVSGRDEGSSVDYSMVIQRFALHAHCHCTCCTGEV
jgi:hypothetical protein